MLQVESISFAYSDTNVVQDVSFELQKGENMSIIGESGCGKSTLLRIINGLHDIHQGAVYFNTKQILGPAYHLVPGDADMKLVAQDFDLMPFTSVAENIGKHLSNIDVSKKKRRIAELLQMIEMEDFEKVHTRYLSGGQKQRVALARALAFEPQLLLLDEPFNQIDGLRKNAFRRNLFGYLKQKNISCIVATHDSIDALSFADQIVVMQNGKIVAQNTPEQLYNTPPSYYVASLFGEVSMLTAKELQLDIDIETPFLIYPHDFKVDVTSDFKVSVKKSYFKGGRFLIQAICNKKALFFESETEHSENEIVGLRVDYETIQKRI